MKQGGSKCRRGWLRSRARRLYAGLTPRAHTLIVFAALFCTLAAKLCHACRYGLLRDYPTWILADVAVLVGVDTVLAVVCHRWRRKAVIRAALVVAALVCTWSVMNAGWLIRTGTQILPMELRPLVGDPLNTLWIVIVNLARAPGPAILLLAPSALALVFFGSVLAKAVPPEGNVRHFRLRVLASLFVSFVALSGNRAAGGLDSTPVGTAGLRFNCHSRAVLSILRPDDGHIAREDFENATRDLPRRDEVRLGPTTSSARRNVVIVVLEGVQYANTLPAGEQGGIAQQTDGQRVGLMPHLSAVAAQGAWFTNGRSVVTHTTKALVALLTGRVPSASQDIAETIPVDPPYAGLATILRDAGGYRTAFFQSAKGTFESRPGLVHNLGFEKFWAREDLGNPDHFVGYLGSDEFSLLGPITDWIRAEDKPFLLVVLCSVTHDPYEVPEWFGPRIKDPAERYRQAIAYTDCFLAALDEQVTSGHLAEDTIFCVAGDHGEGFGEHGIMGHERLAFEEVLRIALCVRAPQLIAPGTRITAPVSSMDLTPTILGLLGFETGSMGFDGVDALRALPEDRRVFFSGWMQEGPAGFMQRDRKYVYDPERDTVVMYDLSADPAESAGVPLPASQAQKIGDDIMAWRMATILRPQSDRSESKTLFDSWLWKDSGRVSRVKSTSSKPL